MGPGQTPAEPGRKGLRSLFADLCTMTPRGFIALETRCHEGQIAHLVGFTRQYRGKMIELFKGQGEIDLSDVPQAFRRPMSSAQHLSVSKPVLSLNAGMTDSVVRTGLAAMSAIRKGEETVVQIVLGRSFSPKTVPKRMQDPHANWLDLALFGIREASSDAVRSAREKAEQFSFQTIIRVGASGKNAEGRVDTICSAFRVLESAGVRIRSTPEDPDKLQSVYIPWHITSQLSTKEITPFFLLPAGEDDLPGVAGIHPKRTQPPYWYKEPDTDSTDRAYAKSLGAVPKKLSISPRDALEHTIILGPTGSGKSTVMENLILSDIKAGRSVLVLDPKADLVLRS